MLLGLGILFMQVSFITMCMPDIYGRQDLRSGDVAEDSTRYSFPFVSRHQWHARRARKIQRMHHRVPYVIIHHSAKPAACYTRARCSAAMRSMQNLHMDGRQWWDIGYNFGVGSDGAAYEGRGWGIQGAHALHYNNNASVGICLIGDWSSKLPPRRQLEVAKKLIASGVRKGWISPHYKLIGHRQVRDTECPGDALYNEIQNWSHYSPMPCVTKDIGVIFSDDSTSAGVADVEVD